jgi:hypothetical protein
LVAVLRKTLSNWDYFSIDFDGLSRIQITRWNHNMTMMNSFSFSSSVSIEVCIKIMGITLTMVNVYGSYQEIK